VLLCLNKDARLRLSSADEFISRLARIRPQLDIYERYRFEEEIGRGSMGIVFRATRRNDGMKVAIKTLDQRLTDETLLKRLQTEATILARLNHRFICKMIETRENFLVMEFVSGEPLSDLIRRTGGLPVSKAISYFKDILEAVGAAHREHVIHRDLKPSNVMITDDPIAQHAIVMDFGIAKLLGSSGMTRTAEGVGAVPYKAPELWERQPPDQRSDIYSLGALLYEMLTSRYPFSGPEIEDFREQHLKQPPEPLPSELSGSNPRLAGLLMKCLEKNPKKRFASVDELYAEISNLPVPQGTQPGSGSDPSSPEFAPTTTGSIPPWPAPARRRRANWWGVGAVLAVAAIIVWQLMPGDKTQSLPPSGVPVQDTSASNAATVPSDARQSDRDDQAAVGGRESMSETDSAPGGESSDRGVEVPIQPVLQVRPRPDDGTRCIVDGHDHGAERDFRIPAGSYRLVLIHPDYPILERTVRLLTSDTTVEYDLSTLFADRQSLDLRIALNPPSQDYSLEITLNGRSNLYSSFPVRNLRLLGGKWKFEARLKPAAGHSPAKAAVDSCVTFPYGGGPRIRVMNAKGEIDFGTSEWTQIQVIPIQVFWSRP
jgi:serine/threonine protein kinase